MDIDPDEVDPSSITEDDDEMEIESEQITNEPSEDPIGFMMRHLANRTGITINARGSTSSGLSTRFSSLLESIKSNDPSAQFMAVQDLNEILSMSTEDSIGPGSGSGFSPEAFIHVLVGIISGESNALGFDNPELQLLGCRCISNLLEALPIPATKYAISNSGLIPVLCMKLTSIEFIDVAEQSISLLTKLSTEHRNEILEAGGLSGILGFLDFFPASVQRMALQCASNLLNQLPTTFFGAIIEITPTIVNVLSHSDQKLVEEASSAISRLVYSLSHARLASIKSEDAQSSSWLSKVCSDQMLKNIVHLLTIHIYGNSSAGIVVSHSSFIYLLKSLKLIGDENSSLAEKIRLGGIHEALYEYLTSEKNIRPSEEVLVVLDLVISLLPETVVDLSLADGRLVFGDKKLSLSSSNSTLLPPRDFPLPIPGNTNDSSGTASANLVDYCLHLLPVMIATYQASVNYSIRVKTLISLVRMIHILDSSHLETILKNVSLAHFLSRVIGRCLPVDEKHHFAGSVASSVDDLQTVAINDSPTVQISSNEESNLKILTTFSSSSGTPLNGPLTSKSYEHNVSHSSLTLLTYAMYLCEILMEKLPSFYSIYLRREGVVYELQNLSEMFYRKDFDSLVNEMEELKVSIEKPGFVQTADSSEDPATAALNYTQKMAFLKELSNMTKSYREKYSEWYKHQLSLRSREFLQTYAAEDSENSACQKMLQLKALAECPLENFDLLSLRNLFLEEDGITSFEFLHSGVLIKLLLFLSEEKNSSRLCKFVENFFVGNLQFSDGVPAKMLITKLNECLARIEPFEIVLPLFTGLDNSAALSKTSNKHAVSMLRRIRFRLKPAEDLEDEIERTISKSTGSIVESEVDVLSSFDIKNLLISIPAVSSLKTIEDFLIPHLSAYFKHKQQEQEVQKQEENKLSTQSRNSSSKTNLEEKGDLQIPVSERFRKDSSVVHDVEKTDEGCAPTFSYSSMVNLSAENWKLDLSLGDLPLTQEMTGYGAVHRFESEMNARAASGVPSASENVIASIFNNYSQRPSPNALRQPSVFSNVYTIRYRPLPKSSTPQQETNFTKFYTHSHNLTIPFADVPYTKYSNCDKEHGCMFHHVLKLLRIVYNINNGKWKEYADETTRQKLITQTESLPASQFVNKKITAKLERQLNEILIISSGLTPSWTRDICHRFGFLVPFSTRLQFMQMTGLSLNRTLMKWKTNESISVKSALKNNDELASLGRISRQKVRVSRSKMFDVLPKIMDNYAAKSKLILEVEFFDEVGTGLGPTLEFYAAISKDWQLAKLDLWRNQSYSADDGLYVQTENGLFPSSMDIYGKLTAEDEIKLTNFKALGQFVAKSFFDFRLIDLPLHKLFLSKSVFGTDFDWTLKKPTKEDLTLLSLFHKIDTISKFDTVLAKSISKIYKYAKLKHVQKGKKKKNELESLTIDNVKLSEMCLDFSVPGKLSSPIDTKPVDMSNVEEYIYFVYDSICERGVERQVSAFREGFNSIFPIANLRSLSVDELYEIIGSGGEWKGKWDRTELADSIKLDHGFTIESQPIQWLLDVLSEMEQQDQRRFVQFITGSPKLPIGGFKALSPPFTIVKRTFESGNADSYLPSVMTCVNYLKLPEYSSIEVMKQRLNMATQEGQGSFHLS